jgi:uncharacterized membrane protein
MTGLYLVVRIVHVLSAAVLFGTGLGTAFQMWAADRSADARTIALVAANVVRADLFFTTPAVVVQPLTGAVLIYLTGTNPLVPWLVLAYGLYGLTGACWLPVVWIQIRLRDLARTASVNNAALPVTYHNLMRVWFWLGWPAFSAVIAIFWLMVARPALW